MKRARTFPHWVVIEWHEKVGLDDPHHTRNNSSWNRWVYGCYFLYGDTTNKYLGHNFPSDFTVCVGQVSSAQIPIFEQTRVSRIEAAISPCNCVPNSYVWFRFIAADGAQIGRGTTTDADVYGWFQTNLWKSRCEGWIKKWTTPRLDQSVICKQCRLATIELLRINFRGIPLGDWVRNFPSAPSKKEVDCPKGGVTQAVRFAFTYLFWEWNE